MPSSTSTAWYLTPELAALVSELATTTKSLGALPSIAMDFKAMDSLREGLAQAPSQVQASSR
eukprot:jgi/Pico_ML_1/54941/g78.t1